MRRVAVGCLAAAFLIGSLLGVARAWPAPSPQARAALNARDVSLSEFAYLKSHSGRYADAQQLVDFVAPPLTAGTRVTLWTAGGRDLCLYLMDGRGSNRAEYLTGSVTLTTSSCPPGLRPFGTLLGRGLDRGSVVLPG
ncbi:MAG: hypothetical protein ACYDAQ_06540 [Mycobacteriales bacterium]